MSVWATVSATPPRTWVRVSRGTCSGCVGAAYGVGDHGRQDGAVGVVAVKLPYENRAHRELDDEHYGVEEGL